MISAKVEGLSLLDEEYVIKPTVLKEKLCELFFFQISYAGLVIFSCLTPTQSPGDLSLMPGMNMITVQLSSAQSNHSRQLLIYV